MGHYERVIVFCCFLFIFVNVGMPSSSISVYQPYITALAGVGDAGGAAILSVRTLCSFAAMFFVNAYLRRLDVRAGSALACMLTGTGFLVYAHAESTAQFFVGAACMGVGYGLGGMVGMTMLVSRWFAARIGTAVGVASVGSGAAAVLIPIAALRLINGVSLSFAFTVEGLVAIGCGVLVFLLLRNKPADIGAVPFGVAEASQACAPAGEDTATTLEEDASYLQLPYGWYALLFVAMAVVGGFCVGGTGYVSVNLTTAGFSYAFAAAMVSVAGGALAVAKFGAGWLIDRTGPRTGTIVLFGMLLTGTLCFTLAPLGCPPLELCGALLYGAGASVGSVGISLWALGLSTPATRARDVRDFQICYNLGSFLFNLVPGVVVGACGSYAPVYALLLLAGLYAAAVIVAAYARYRPVLG